jgi:2-C-methyl-D-erythritol 4-phosphate cytidylyltransferase / 2-C-methyl-D-erythritol 2,4-cyclodiphosphate synthase
VNANAPPRQAAIIVAAGIGSRTGFDRPKQFMPLAGKPVLRWSAEAFAAAGVFSIVVVIDAAHRADVDAALAGVEGVRIAIGGATRTASVRAGIAALTDAEAELVHIHDAARPGLTSAMIGTIAAAFAPGIGAVAPALPVADALKIDTGGGAVSGPARAGLYRVQTPQTMRLAPFRAGLQTLANDAAFDDDLAIAEQIGLRCALVAGEQRLMKLTYAEDLAMLEQMIGPRLSPRIGAGTDAHRFGPGDHVTLCGVKIAHNASLIGHSDADAAWHALTDALLGAIGAGDIGDHFPPSDPRWKGAPSGVFLKHAADLIAARGGRIGNVDVTIICERPKIKPYREAMRAKTAEVLGVALERVSVKATTMEEMGFTGREEGLATQATALVMLPETNDV